MKYFALALFLVCVHAGAQGDCVQRDEFQNQMQDMRGHIQALENYAAVSSRQFQEITTTVNGLIAYEHAQASHE